MGMITKAGSDRFPGQGTEDYCDCAFGMGRKASDEARRREANLAQFESLVRRAEIPRRYADASMAHFTGDPFQSEAANLAVENIKPEAGHGLILWGGVGVGKTYLAAAVLRECLLRGFGGLFVAVPDLLDRIRATYAGVQNSYPMIERTQDISVLLLDDIGAQNDTDWGREKVYQIVNARYNDRKTIIATSNMDLQTLAKRVGDRIVSRLVDMCTVIRLEGPDRRLG